ncbi:IS66 family transposase [Massilia sp. PAMC28688]|uniref:IS66 family transposase n=1 Tax=Massilia sp. PAMC28688 TaxID=2861283 RepID=UPI001C636784|nr:IS66 family transposase [Massilia sp. PAMC28688]QYF92250.1 IS66 family transposase [Massilia sp. PAMC28688]QYF92683.1 IS66 family transposase [Massilia sp. PAMC28688]QYF94894.1 IS66 family transposase [Massilia sp. PAMC28688]
MDLLNELADLDIAPAALAKVQALFEQQQAKLAQRDAVLAEKDFKITALTHELAYYKRVRFGKASEALVGAQRLLFEETVDTDLAAIDEELQAQAPVNRQRKRAGRQPLPAHLERIEHRHEPESCLCGQCGADLVKIGEDVSEQLDVEPARFFVHRHIRPQYACRPCETVTAAPIPPAVIDGGMAAVGLLAWIAVCKYLDHLPLYRIEQIAARDGVPLARSTLGEWIGRIGVALQPLADRLAELLRQRSCLHADETPVRQLDPGSGKTKHAYLWAYRSNVLDDGSGIVVFDYQTSRAGAHARAFLQQWRGHLMVDDYVGYKALFTAGPTELACLAHIRRKFFDVHAASGSPVAEEALRRIGQLYAIEQQAAGMTAQQRAALREQLAMPVLADLHGWLVATQRSVAAGSGTAKAIEHALKRWAALQCYASSGSLPIDNNPVENAIRPIAIGKKNWLFAGSERAGRRAAAIQSLFATAKLNGLDPARWLADTLAKLPTCPNSKIDSLLPFANSTQT